MIKLSIIGNGYTAQYLSKEALKKGIQVSIITRNISNPKKNIYYFNYFDSKNIAEKLSKENIISTVPPNEEGLDPVIQNYGKSIASNKNKIIYFSATSVYGEGEIEEETKPDPKHNRGIIRLNAEEEWIKTNQKTSIFRIAGIYGPKRHPMIKYLEGNNEILVKKNYIPNIIAKLFNKDLKDKIFTLWGLAFKPGTDDVREAPSIEIIKFILSRGGNLNLYDPEALGKIKQIFQEDNIQYFEDKYEALEGSSALIIPTEWSEFKNIDLDTLRTKMKQRIIIDGRNIFNPDNLIDEGIEYYGVSRGNFPFALNQSL